MKSIFLVLVLMAGSVASALPAQEWSCKGASYFEGEYFYSFNIRYSEWAAGHGYATQEVVLKDALIYDMDGNGSSLIDLTKGTYCPNSETTEYPTINLEPISSPNTKAPVGAKVEILYGCGDGFGIFDLTGYCEKTF